MAAPISDPKPNPASAPETQTAPARKRIPMSIPTQKLEVPAIPGFHLHWFLNRNVPRALQGGYEKVMLDEVPVNSFAVGADPLASGSSSLGSDITIVSGAAEFGGFETLHLMKLREEHWRSDQKELEQRNAAILSGIFRNEQIGRPGEAVTENPDDRGSRYLGDRTRAPNIPLFQRPSRKAVQT